MAGGVAFGVALDGDTDYSELVVVKSRKAEEVTRWMEGIRAGLWAQQGSVDGGSEFLGALRVWARRHGIEVGMSAPGQHQHNPYAERYWLGLLNKLRVVFLQSEAPAFLAGEFAIALNAIRNMLPTAKSLVYGRSPFELHTGKKPNVSSLPLGSMVIVHDYNPSRGGVRRNKYMPRGVWVCTSDLVRSVRACTCLIRIASRVAGWRIFTRSQTGGLSRSGATIRRRAS